VLEFDFPGLRIGVAEYREGPTGCTVFHFPAGAALAIDARGGSPAYVGDFGWTHAVCLSGGSVYGLEAVAGVAAELLAQREYATGWEELALVAGAVIYDFGSRDNAIYPDTALGRAALRAARPGHFPLGPRGAGCSATTGKGLRFDRGEAAGQGGAVRQIGATKVAVFTVVNAIGVVVDRQGGVVRGGLDPRTGHRSSLLDEAEQIVAELDEAPTSGPARGNTTLTVVVTNQHLEHSALRQLGRQVHVSMARAIQPLHTPYDGDVLFAVTTAEVTEDGLDEVALGVIAAEVAWDAVLTSWER
jgi:L-aminopeptidase/D-esterase-like protein